MPSPFTIWDSHVITDLGNGFVLLHRPSAADDLSVRAPAGGVEKGYAPAQRVSTTPDHAISTAGPHREDFPPAQR